jgi:uncharacterized membrane protein YcaP (DUF421 family)
VFGQSTEFDIVAVVLIGSTLSRAVTGNAQLLPTIAAATVLIVLHGVLARLSYRWSTIGWLTKGEEIRLVDGGQLNRRAMRRSGITERDLLEAARSKGTEDLSRIDVAVLEPDQCDPEAADRGLAMAEPGRTTGGRRLMRATSYSPSMA